MIRPLSRPQVQALVARYVALQRELRSRLSHAYLGDDYPAIRATMNEEGLPRVEPDSQVEPVNQQIADPVETVRGRLRRYGDDALQAMAEDREQVPEDLTKADLAALVVFVKASMKEQP